MMKKLAILGFPRSATKLLADVYVQQGYHSFGEFFNPNNTEIVFDTVPYAKRMSMAGQYEIFKSRQNISNNLNHHKQSLVIESRVSLFNQYKDVEPSIVTVWLENIYRSPELMSMLEDRFVLCTRREDKFEQLLSRMVTWSNLNCDAEAVSKPININLVEFEYNFYIMTRVEKLQEYFVKQGKGKYIDFNELVDGICDVGFDYAVTSDDQHDDLHKLIINLDEVKEKYKILQTQYI